VVNPRRLYRPSDVAWDACSEADGTFLDDAGFAHLFDGEALIGVTGGSAACWNRLCCAVYTPRDTFAWKRGETAASAAQVMAINGLTADNFVKRAQALLG
jgi:phosphoketolase